jgi:hypothetical protein
MCNADAVYYVNKLVPSIKAFGGVVLNWTVGGFNPFAVDVAIQMGAKQIWMGNMHTGRYPSTEAYFSTYGYTFLRPGHPWHKRLQRHPKWLEAPPLNALNENGNLKPELFDIFDLIAEADVILATCHLTKAEVQALVPEARKAGVKKVLITHIDITSDDKQSKPGAWTLSEVKDIVAEGAIPEIYWASYCSTYEYTPNSGGKQDLVADMIRTVAARNCCLTSGGGVLSGMHPIDMMRDAVFHLQQRGISQRETDTMTKDVPAWLLGLEDTKP